MLLPELGAYCPFQLQVFMLTDYVGVVSWLHCVFVSCDNQCNVWLFACVIVNCWPSESGGKCEVNIEYELQQEDMELQDVQITIPVP